MAPLLIPIAIAAAALIAYRAAKSNSQSTPGALNSAAGTTAGSGFSAAGGSSGSSGSLNDPTGGTSNVPAPPITGAGDTAQQADNTLPNWYHYPGIAANMGLSPGGSFIDPTTGLPVQEITAPTANSPLGYFVGLLPGYTDREQMLADYQAGTLYAHANGQAPAPAPPTTDAVGPAKPNPTQAGNMGPAPIPNDAGGGGGPAKPNPTQHFAPASAPAHPAMTHPPQPVTHTQVVMPPAVHPRHSTPPTRR